MAHGKPPREQRTLLQPHETPSKHFVETFKVSKKLSESLAAERKSVGTGPSMYQKNQRDGRVYVEEARMRPLPPLERVVAEQEILSELRRDAHHAGPKIAESAENRVKRLAGRDVFLASRKKRHDDAVLDLERKMDALAEECQAEVQKLAASMRTTVEETDKNINELLIPLETDTEFLGERDEDEVRLIMTNLDQVIEDRRARIDTFHRDLEEVDMKRKHKSMSLMGTLVELLTAAAHAVPGEVERLVEMQTHALNETLLTNQRAAKDLRSKLLVQTLEKSKENKTRWNKGMLLWKQKRHRHALEVVMERIRSNEFRQPDIVDDILARLREQQSRVFYQRTSLVAEFFNTEVRRLTTSNNRTWEDQNNSLNDRAQDDFEKIFGELKEAKESLEVKGEHMLSGLCAELEAHDARSEWGDFTSVSDLVEAEVRPGLQECLDIVNQLMVKVTDVVTNLDEAQHAVVVKMVAYFLGLARKQEKLKKHKEEFEVNYQGDVEDCVREHEDWCRRAEEKMDEHKEDINGAAHFDELDEFKQQAFNHLDEMALQYRKHAETLTGIHKAYPGQVLDFMQEEAQGFCEELGLITEAAHNKPPPEGEEPPAEDAEASAELSEWPEAEGCGVRVLEQSEPPQVRVRLVGPLGIVAYSPVPEGDGEAAPDPEGEAAAEREPDDGNPRRADGEPVLEMLNFEAEWIESRIVGLRSGIFAHLTEYHTHLARIDIAGHCEDVARDLDQVLRKHTNRKGEVQVELYVPRYSTIAKHKDRFERHLIEVARKSQANDDLTDQMHKEFEAKEQGFQERLTALRDQLQEAETLPKLTSFERQANDAAAEFRNAANQIKAELLRLATKAPESLKLISEGYLMMCKSGGENYSRSEIEFYGSEIKELNKSLDERAGLRKERHDALQSELEQKIKQPLEEFITNYKQAVEDLCASKGYGREHGAPRRRAQERVRTLISRAATVKNNIITLLEYFSVLLEHPVEEAAESKELPKCELFQLPLLFKKASERWVFTGEVIGNLHVLSCSLNTLGSHLEAFKPDHAPKYKLESAPAIRVLKEAEALVGDDPEAKEVEDNMRDDCLMQVLGPMMRAAPFNAEIQSVVTEANATYASKGGTPDFMQKFLEDMQVTADSARQDAALGVREKCDNLRDEVLLKVGDAVFGELAARSVRELYSSLQEAQADTISAWGQLDGQRKSHEKRLGPRLANPNAEKELADLLNDEAQRYKAAQIRCRDDRSRIVVCLRKQVDIFVQRLAATFEAAVKLIDSLPLHSHFTSLPGDEHVEPARMSIKRRMRRLQKGEELHQHGDGLPERTWQGVPRYELRQLLRGSEWPVDIDLREATPEQLAELSPAVKSFRSPVHKKLFERRNFYYSSYKSKFTQEANSLSADLQARETKEQAGQKNWASSVKQLNGDAVIPVFELEEEPPEEPAAAPAPTKSPRGKQK